jgi:hypothetical protein
MGTLPFEGELTIIAVVVVVLLMWLFDGFKRKKR